MRAVLIAFLLGAAAVGFAAGAAAVASVIVADAGGWDSFRIALGPLLVVEFDRSGTETEATFGAGIAVAAVGGGLLNAAGAALLRRRRDRLH